MNQEEYDALAIKKGYYFACPKCDSRSVVQVQIEWTDKSLTWEPSRMAKRNFYEDFLLENKPIRFIKKCKNCSARNGWSNAEVYQHFRVNGLCCLKRNRKTPGGKKNEISAKQTESILLPSDDEENEFDDEGEEADPLEGEEAEQPNPPEGSKKKPNASAVTQKRLATAKKNLPTNEIAAANDLMDADAEIDAQQERNERRNREQMLDYYKVKERDREAAKLHLANLKELAQRPEIFGNLDGAKEIDPLAEEQRIVESPNSMENSIATDQESTDTFDDAPIWPRQPNPLKMIAMTEDQDEETRKKDQKKQEARQRAGEKEEEARQREEEVADAIVHPVYRIRIDDDENEEENSDGPNVEEEEIRTIEREVAGGQDQLSRQILPKPIPRLTRTELLYNDIEAARTRPPPPPPQFGKLSAFLPPLNIQNIPPPGNVHYLPPPIKKRRCDMTAQEKREDNFHRAMKRKNQEAELQMLKQKFPNFTYYGEEQSSRPLSQMSTVSSTIGPGVWKELGIPANDFLNKEDIMDLKKSIRSKAYKELEAYRKLNQ